MDGRISMAPARAEPTQDSARGGSFGEVFTDHCLSMTHVAGDGWQSAAIGGYEKLPPVAPAAKVLHYGQGIFEGMKAFADTAGRVRVWRLEKHLARFARSAFRMAMPEPDLDRLAEGILELVALDVEWTPRGLGTALYIRPILVGTEPSLGVAPSSSYHLFVMLSPVGDYYKGGAHRLRILAEEEFSRAAPGGTGDIKAIGNYGASLLAAQRAKQRGYDQTLWLDVMTRSKVEEVGNMNLFFVIDGELVTPSLSGTIMPGITRDCVLTLAREAGIATVERDVPIAEVTSRSEDGSLSECFGTGTAAVVTPVGVIGYQGHDYPIGAGSALPMTARFFESLTALQYGRVPDRFGWTSPVRADVTQ